MQTLVWLQAHMPFLNTEWFTYVYGLVVFLNAPALAPQLISSIRSKPEELRGVSIFMFFIFLAIQSAIALGAVKIFDAALFWSMAISAVETFLIIVITLSRRSGDNGGI